MFAFVVIHDFGDYSRGERIDDPKEMAAVEASANAGNVVRVAVPDPTPAAVSPNPA